MGCEAMYRRVLSSCLCLVLGVTAGCYQYVPASIEQIDAGESVRARIPFEEAERLRDVFALKEPVVEGKVLERTPDALVLSVKTGTVHRRLGSRTLEQRVRLRTADVMSVDTRELNRLRTLLGGTVLAGVIGYVAVTQFGAPPEGGTVDEEPTPNEFVAPSFQVRIPIGN